MDSSKIDHDVLKQEVEALHRATARLNLYTHNIKTTNIKNVSSELENIYRRIKNVYDMINP